MRRVGDVTLARRFAAVNVVLNLPNMYMCVRECTCACASPVVGRYDLHVIVPDT